MDKNELSEKIAWELIELLSLDRFISDIPKQEKIKNIILDNLEDLQLPPFDPLKPSTGLIGSDGLSDSTPQERS